MTIMKNVISQLIDDFHERNLPELVTRNKEFSEVKGKADVVIGMRRAGKTWFCYQKIKDLIASGIKKEEILYLNFEDDRLLEFNVNNFQEILDVYFGKYPEHLQLVHSLNQKIYASALPIVRQHIDFHLQAVFWLLVLHLR